MTSRGQPGFVRDRTAKHGQLRFAKASALLVGLCAILALGLASSLALAQTSHPSAGAASITVCRKVNGHWRQLRLSTKLIRRTDAPAFGRLCPVANRVILCHLEADGWHPSAFPPAMVAAAIADGDRRPAFGRCPSFVTPTTTAGTTTTAPVTTISLPPPPAAAPSPPPSSGPPPPPVTTATTATTTTVSTTTTTDTTTTATTTTGTTTTTSSGPLVVITQPPATTFVTGTTTIAISVGGGTAPYVPVLSIDGSATSLTPTGSDSSFTFAWDTTSAAEGRHTLTVGATDGAGAQGTSAPVQVTIDRSPPLVALTAPSAGSFAAGTLNASADASDLFGVANVQFAIDGTPAGTPVTTPVGQIYSATLPLAGLADGAHTLTAIALDNAGHLTTSSGVSFNVGIQPLAAAIVEPPDLHFATGVTSVVASVTGGVGPYSLQLLVDGGASGGPVASTTLSWDTAGLTETLHALAVRVTDSRGVAVTSPTIQETVDNTPPTVLALAPPDGDRDNGPTLFKVDASDAHGIASVQFTVDGNAAGPLLTTPDVGSAALYSTMFDTSTLTSGTHVVAATVTDNAGHTAQAPSATIKTGTISFLPVLNYHGIDLTPPDEYELTPAVADAELAYLAANGYQSVTLEQYQQWLNGADLGIAKPVLITIDDGLTDQLAWDALLAKYNFKAVMFVVTGFADNVTPGDTGLQNLTWAQLQSLAATGRWEMAFHAGKFGHGDAFGQGEKADGISYTSACPYFYSCLGIGETVAQFEAAVEAEVSAGVAELKSEIPSASSLAWAAPFNDAGQWTNLYDDPTVEDWLPGYFAAQFPIVFTQTSPVEFAGASGTVGSLTGFGRHYRFEVHSNTAPNDFSAALTDPAFER